MTFHTPRLAAYTTQQTIFDIVKIYGERVCVCGTPAVHTPPRGHHSPVLFSPLNSRVTRARERTYYKDMRDVTALRKQKQSIFLF